MKKILILIVWICSLQIMATNVVVECRMGTDLLQDIATIGKWIYLDDNMQLVDKEGNILAEESLENIKKITFTTSTSSAVEEVPTHSIVIYPNPTQDVLMIRGIEAQVLRVYDLQGRVVKKTIGTEVTVGDLAEGTYLLQVGTQVMRLIKQ